MRKPLVWLHGEVKTPPLSTEARMETGFLLARLQEGELLSMPHSRPVTALGPRCHELRVVDGPKSWRIIYRLDSDSILILDIFAKKTRRIPKSVLDSCRLRMAEYDRI